MKKMLMSLMVVGLLAGCSPSTKEISHSYVLPEELKHCSIYRLFSGDGSLMTVVHRPNANTTTSYTSGKSVNSVTVVSE